MLVNRCLTVRPLGDVIKTDVVSSDDSDFMAVHVPFKELRFADGGSSDTPFISVSEDELYSRVIMGVRDRHQFVIVRGPNGAGKSHLIRWMAVRLQRDIDTAHEAVLFIKRADNTLKGTLQQLIDSDLVTSQKLQDELRALADAETHLSDSNLKATILDQFAIEAEQEQDYGTLSAYERSCLASFLRHSDVRAKLLAEGAPISRIHARLTSGSPITDVQDAGTPFVDADLEVGHELLVNMERTGAERTAQSMAERLNDHQSDHAKRVAKYLSNITEQVIQNCARLKGADLKRLFDRIRKDLYASGRSLTLFIEDITAFAGIDRALVDVLVTDHEGGSSSEPYCRLCSVVGITTAYYEQFRDNFKDRVTAQVEVAEDALGTEQSLSEMAARYINVLHLPHDTIRSWAQQGADPRRLPVQPHRELLDWETVQLETGQTLTLFPFTRKALVTLHGMLNQRTPRLFLKNVIAPQVDSYEKDLDHFPNLRSLKYDEMPQWNPLTHQSYLDDIEPMERRQRLEVLLRVWGDANVYRTGSNGRVQIGGLDERVFRAFGLDLIDGIRTDRGASPEVTPIAEASSDRIAGPPAGPGPEQRQRQGGVPESNRQGSDFGAQLSIIERWMNGEPMSDFEPLRDSLHDYLVTAINWQSEGVPYWLARSILEKRGRISIEGQARGGEDSILMLRRSPEGRSVLQALAAWRHLGNRSWDFPDAPVHQFYLVNWTFSIKDQMIAAMVSPSGPGSAEWPMFEWACFAEYWHLVMNGELTGTESEAEVFRALLEPYSDHRGHRGQLGTDAQSGHCENWKKLAGSSQENERAKNNKRLIQDYLNRQQGRITAGTDKHFIDAHDFLLAIRRLADASWWLQLPVISHGYRQDHVMYLSYGLADRYIRLLPAIAADERNEASAIMARLENLLGTLSDKTVRNALVASREFLNNLATYRVPYERALESKIQQLNRDEKHVLSALTMVSSKLEDAAASQATPGDLIVFATDPLSHLKAFLQLLSSIEETARELIASEAAMPVDQISKSTEVADEAKIVREAIDASLQFWSGMRSENDAV